MTRDTGTREEGWASARSVNILNRVSSGEEKTKRMKRRSVQDPVRVVFGTLLL